MSLLVITYVVSNISITSFARPPTLFPIASIQLEAVSPDITRRGVAHHVRWPLLVKAHPRELLLGLFLRFLISNRDFHDSLQESMFTVICSVTSVKKLTPSLVRKWRSNNDKSICLWIVHNFPLPLAWRLFRIKQNDSWNVQIKQFNMTVMTRDSIINLG